VHIERREKLIINVLIPLWGTEYINDFTKFTLPALLFPGNIPLATQAHRVNVSLITTEQDKENIQKNPEYKRLDDITTVNYIFIDDVVIDYNYSVILTVAYWRGIRAIPDNDYFNTLIIFLNSDFILSDGSLGSIIQKAQNGASAIYGASLRIIAEETRSILAAKLMEKNPEIFFQPQNLVNFALKHLHPTVEAMILNQKKYSYKIYTKLYWKISKNLLVSHDYLLCCMGIVPTKKIGKIKSYIDYSFVPELTDLTNLHYIDDSDEYLALEMQNFDKEIEFISNKSMSLKKIANHFSTWTTQEHRNAANHLIKFHSKEISKSERKFEEFEEKYVQIKNFLKKPIDYMNHPHWINGVQSWRYHASKKNTEIEIQVLPIFENLTEQKDNKLKYFFSRILVFMRKIVKYSLNPKKFYTLTSSKFSAYNLDFKILTAILNEYARKKIHLTIYTDLDFKNLNFKALNGKNQVYSILDAYADLDKQIELSRLNEVVIFYTSIKEIQVLFDSNLVEILQKMNKSLKFIFRNDKITQSETEIVVNFTDKMINLLTNKSSSIECYQKIGLISLLRKRKSYLNNLYPIKLHSFPRILLNVVSIYFCNVIISLTNCLPTIKRNNNIIKSSILIIEVIGSE
jgi:hypothetical protein